MKGHIFYLWPVVATLWLLQPIFLKDIIEKSENTEKNVKMLSWNEHIKDFPMPTFFMS